MKRKNKKGFGLLETLLTLGAISALSLGVYMALKPASASAQAKTEQDNLRDMASAIEGSFGILGGYDGLTASRVITDGLNPRRMLDNGALITSWGSVVEVSPVSIGAPNDAFAITYPSTPADVCARLAAAVFPQVFDLKVNGTSVLSGGSLDPSETAARCGSGNQATMEFIYYSGLVAGSAVAAPPLVLPDVPPSVSTPPTAPIGAPVADVGAVGGADALAPVTVAPQEAEVAPPMSAAPELTPIVPTTPPSSASPVPVPPPTTVAACSVPANTVQTQSLNCSSGQYGRINQSRTVTWGCPEAWDKPEPVAYSAWTTTSNTCTACPGASTQTETQWVNASADCPSGQTGSNTWQKEQRRTRSVNYNCPAGTESLPGPTYGGWSAWSDTGAKRNASNTCKASVSNGNYQVIEESCWSETNYYVSSLDEQARLACQGRPIGSEGGTIQHFPDYQIGCYATIICK